jgi:hypothetical protein
VKESDIVREILEYLKANDVWAWRNPNGGVSHHGGNVKARTPTPGAPDIMGILPCGRSLQIEVKLPKKGVVSDAQAKWIMKAMSNNAVAFIATCVGDVYRILVSACDNCIVKHEEEDD